MTGHVLYRILVHGPCVRPLHLRTARWLRGTGMSWNHQHAGALNSVLAHMMYWLR